MSPSRHLRTETDAVSETLCFLICRISDIINFGDWMLEISGRIPKWLIQALRKITWKKNVSVHPYVAWDSKPHLHCLRGSSHYTVNLTITVILFCGLFYDCYILLQLVLGFSVCIPFITQQYQYLKLNNFFKFHHCTTYFGLLVHHQVRWNSGELLCLSRYCDRCFHIHNVYKWSRCSSPYMPHVSFFWRACCLSSVQRGCNL
jgi:hypothetical protein